MGYCSQVSMAIVGPVELMLSALVTFRLKQPEHFVNLPEDIQYVIADEQLRIIFQSDDAKWYTDYKDVAATTALFNFFEKLSEDNDINGSFARIGENDDDVETDSYGSDPYDLVQVCRSIDSQYPIDPTKPFGVIPEWKPTLT